jgi:hypothetical protein
MNSTIMLPQFSYCRSSIWGAYWMTYAGGLNVRQFVRMLRHFSGAFVGGIVKHEYESAKAPKAQLTLMEPSV